MFKVIVDNKVVDLINDNITYIKVDENDRVMFCNKEGANAILCQFDGIYQIDGTNNVQSTKYPICSLLTVDKNEYDELYEQLVKNITIDIVEEEPEEIMEKATAQPVNLLNEIADLKAKLNELLNK